jgi:hypothetical protein
MYNSCIYVSRYRDGFAQSIKQWSQKRMLLDKDVPNAGKNRRIAVSIIIEENDHC